MGFGYLLLGYLVSFVLSLSVDRLGLGGLAELLGYAMMLYGLLELQRYQRAFVPAKWLTLPALVCAVVRLVEAVDELFLWDLPLFGDTPMLVLGWLEALVAVVFQLAMLYGIRMIATDVELKHVATKALRNMLFVGMYGVLYAAAQLPSAWIGTVAVYLQWPLLLLQIVCIALNLLLLLSCNKNICAAGDEDQPRRPSRFGFINRMNETYERNRQQNAERAKRDAQELVRRRRERKKKK